MNNKKEVFQSSVLVAIFSLIMSLLIWSLTIFPQLVLCFIGGIIILTLIGFYIIVAVAYVVQLFFYILQLLGIQKLFKFIVQSKQAKKE